MSGVTVDELTLYLQVFAVFAALLGACIGSFLNVCIYRIPNELSVVRPRSFCPSCAKEIPWYLNIPVFSWIMLRGKCAFCGTKIASRYLFVELLTAMFFLMVYAAWCVPGFLHLTPLHAPAQIPVYWLFISGLMLGSFIDLDHYILPDRVTIGGMILGPLLSMLVPELQGEAIWWRALMKSGLGLAAGFGLFFLIGVIGERVFKKEAMGFGDVKLMGAVGAFLGWESVLFTLFVSSLLGTAVAGVLLALKRVNLKDVIPYGPYLAVGAVIWLFWGRALLGLYLNFLLPGRAGL